MRKLIFFSIVLLLLVISGYVYWYYYNVYSEGYREGILQKFSHRGNVFKTYEGEVILLGFGRRATGIISANYFYFSVDNKVVADSLDNCLGKSLRLHYVQYRRALPWRGENYNGKNSDNGQYVVDRIDDVREATY